MHSIEACALIEDKLVKLRHLLSLVRQIPHAAESKWQSLGRPTEGSKISFLSFAAAFTKLHRRITKAEFIIVNARFESFSPLSESEPVRRMADAAKPLGVSRGALTTATQKVKRPIRACHA